MTNDAARIFRLETLLKKIQQLVSTLQGQVQNLQQQQYQPTGTGTGGGGANAPYFSTPSVAVPASLGGSITNQTVVMVSGGVFAQVTTTATIWNPRPVATTPNKQLFLLQNNDGTYSVIDWAC